MIDTSARTLLNHLATLQRRHSGAIILVSSHRTHAWPDVAPEAKVPINRAQLRALEAEGLVMVEPYTESKPRGTQILGMTSKGWRLAEPDSRPSTAPLHAA